MKKFVLSSVITAPGAVLSTKKKDKNKKNITSAALMIVKKVSCSDHQIISFSSQSKGDLLLQRPKDESSRLNLERDEVLFQRKFLGHDTLEKHDTENRNPAVFLKPLS